MVDFPNTQGISEKPNSIRELTPSELDQVAGGA
jgi:hypothetical protein